MLVQKSHKILVVEDEGLIAQDIVNRLEALGHQVVAVATTAAEALEEAGRSELGIDVVLMDIRLDGPDDGIVAATGIREKYNLPVIFLTAHADRSTLELAKRAGPFGYLVKPLQPASLSTTLEVAIYKHRMERELAEREALLAAVLRSVADAVAVLDAKGTIRMINRACEALSGWTDAEAKGKPLSEVLPLSSADLSGFNGPPGFHVSPGPGASPGDAASVPNGSPGFPGSPGAASGPNGSPGAAAGSNGSSVVNSPAGAGASADDLLPMALLRDTPASISPNTHLRTRTGKLMLVEGSAAPVRTAGLFTGVVLNLRDVSTRRWEEQQLRVAQKMDAAGRLANSISSEYANLLAIIRSQSGQLLQQFAEYSPVRLAAEEIEQAARAAEQINRRLAGFSARAATAPEVLSLNAILRRMRKLIDSVAGGRISVTMQPNPATGKIRADGPQMEQLIMNLVMHACSRMPDGGELRIETSNVELPLEGRMVSCVRLAVTHSGTEPELEKLFEPASVREEHLALSVAHNIVTEHAGFLSVRPQVGGFCFEALMPRSSEPVTDLPPASQLVPSVLLVEQHDLVRSQIHNFFEANGLNLLEASDATEAAMLAELHEGSLDLLIADASQSDALAEIARKVHPEMQTLSIVDATETSNCEIARPFTQAALLERVQGILGLPSNLEAANASA